MNIENAKKLISQLERLPDERFDMCSYVRHENCGTVACIAGWVWVLNDGENKYVPESEPEHSEFFEFGKEYLGLSEEGAVNLFLMCQQWTRTDAISELRRLVELGV